MEKQKSSGYQTGPTHPPKSSGSLVAVLLVAVIFLGGLTTALGILNIRLQNKLTLIGEKKTPIAFSPADEAAATASLPEAAFDSLGLYTETVTPFIQSYYDVPAGIYVTLVAPESLAQTAGLQTGDIILTANDTPTTDVQTLQTILDACKPGDTLTLTVYQAGETHAATLILD